MLCPLSHFLRRSSALSPAPPSLLHFFSFSPLFHGTPKLSAADGTPPPKLPVRTRQCLVAVPRLLCCSSPPSNGEKPLASFSAGRNEKQAAVRSTPGLQPFFYAVDIFVSKSLFSIFGLIFIPLLIIKIVRYALFACVSAFQELLQVTGDRKSVV